MLWFILGFLIGGVVGVFTLAVVIVGTGHYNYIGDAGEIAGENDES
jgi:hypothetical protein